MRAKLYRGRWYAVWIEGGKTRRTALRAADREAAERNLSDLKRALTVEAKTVAEIMKAYLADREGRASHESMRYAWQALQPVFGHLRPDQITRDLCRDYVTRRRRSAIKDGTIIKELSVL